ncbi:hypothetical protein [Sphingobium cupriresistens]|uniref:Uncharacterized protein n=1 Tax=Sphingobium cupriresistens TaxID=1132417 RepID=A0A8G1ZEN9_9SPHN|nr:hypothetical protein [Sphingobium cupriresistens]RYM09632.1 hypothetical protein EWH12_13660 [Sphingobium cupriresistens]
MTLKLDIRGPIVVLVAEFNSAIFQPPWIAKHLFGKAEGDEMAAAEILIQNGPLLIQLTFLEGVAINVAPNRTEIFALDAEPETLARAEGVLLKMLEVLPHTPLAAVGCNLSYVDDDPSTAIAELFTTPEGFEAEGVLNSRQSGVQLQLEGEQVLNFVRLLGPKEARYSFNYHRAESDAERYKNFVPGMIAKAREDSETLLKSLYGYEGCDVIGFVAGNQQEGNGDDSQTTH